MKIIYVQTYPVYHDMIDNAGFLAAVNRDKLMPMITKDLGHESELWATGSPPAETEWKFKNHSSVPVRIFAPDNRSGNTKNHTSEALNKAALQAKADLFVLKGMDGGTGVHLVRNVLIPNNIPFAIVIGGTWYHPLARHASSVLYETEWQRRMLASKSWRFWRSVLPDEKLIRLPKSVDTSLFKPLSNVEKEFDVIAVGRLIPLFKNYKTLFELSKHVRVAAIGGGPLLEKFRKRYPDITWFGAIAHSDVPVYLNKTHLLFYSSRTEFFPRVIAEAAACGVPPVAFGDGIHEDVISGDIGLRVSNDRYISEILSLLRQKEKLSDMSKAARSFAEQNWGLYSSKQAIERMVARVTLR